MVEATVVDDIRTDIERERWSLLLQNVRASTLPTVFVGAIYAAFFTQFAAVPQTWMWWLALVSVLALRWWVARPAASESESLPVAPIWLFYLIMLATGTIWGIAPVLIAWLVDEIMMFTALLFATGIGIAAFGSYGINLYAVLAVTAPIGVASLGAIAASGNPAYYAVGVALVLLYAHQFVVIRQARHVLETQIRLRLENAMLAEQLGADAEKTTAELSRRMDTERLLRAARDRAEKMSATDGLTGIANRRYFDKRLNSEISRAFRDRTYLSLVICDIDYFKQFNDLYGHQEGDECIKSFARILESYCRRGGDLAARIGGEEFALLLPSTDHEAALKLAENTRTAFDELAIRHAGSQIKDNVTASFGISTTMPDDTGAGETLMGVADKALYLAKGQGRNQVVSETLVGTSAIAGG
ncbi:MAG: diguanylate cyclase [Gammaproteobacteria bacterium]|nr:diguanylate cyclase [Gammaproteobacteria bacterium]